jgi:2,3-bisphosphoglycerate-independent phosphoglycerate mutase
MKHPTVLCILDGWGHREDKANNSIAAAHTPNWNRFLSKYPYSLLQASEGYVGLPAGQMGNSEVGHMSIGAGRTVLQALPRINEVISEGKLPSLPKLKDLIHKLKTSGGVCHLMGLLSTGGVHSHQDHMVALAHVISAAQIPIIIHAFLDGRDTPPQSAVIHMEEFLNNVKANQKIQIGTVSGRYYAMDRDQRWDRIYLAYEAIVKGVGQSVYSALNAIEDSYNRNTTDEFMIPSVITGYHGMKDGDGILMANFRADRVRQLLTSLLDPCFNQFDVHKRPRLAASCGMIQYSSRLASLTTALFSPLKLTNVLGEVIAKAGFSQLRIAETEKYAHITFFFNGGREDPFQKEQRLLIPSPKVATYDLKPEMSAYEITEQLCKIISYGKFDFIVVNYANADMVGHTGLQVATQQAIEKLDNCLGKLEEGVLKAEGDLLITADHGNAEQMLNIQTGKKHTAHTCNPVPFVLIRSYDKSLKLKAGSLCDIAPTILDLLNLKKPIEMTGISLLINKS